MTDQGRLHVHLQDLKEPFKARCGHGDISGRIRDLVRAYLEERIMILSDEVLAVIDKGDHDAAVELMLPGLQKLREERLQDGQKKTKARKDRKAASGQKKGGVKAEKQKAVDGMYNQLMEGYK